MITIAETVSRVRSLVKGAKQDAFLTDRYIYSLISKHAKLLIRRQDSTNKMMKFTSVFQFLEFVELEEVDRVTAGCANIRTGCVIKRTKQVLPDFFEGYYGPLIRSVSSLDGSVILQPTLPSVYESLSNQKTFRYNKRKYFWYHDGRLYFPDIPWDAVRIDGVFEDDISCYQCAEPSCEPVQGRRFNVPEFLFPEIETAVLRDLSMMLEIPPDPGQDIQNAVR